MEEITVRQVDYNSAEYRETLELRNRVLRLPLGQSVYEDNLETEPHDYHIAAFAGERMVGTLVLTIAEEGTLRMRQVGVEPALQGKGVGRLMVAFAERLTREQGRSRLYLHARQLAVDFYLALGYRIIGEPFTEVGIPHREMEKLL